MSMPIETKEIRHIYTVLLDADDIDLQLSVMVVKPAFKSRPAKSRAGMMSMFLQKSIHRA